MESPFAPTSTDRRLFDEYFYGGSQDANFKIQKLGSNNIDDAFAKYDSLVDDWKLKLELIIADGLKKLRKSSKEKKMMIKYIPGDEKTDFAKEYIMMELKSEFGKAIGSTHRKLERLSSAKLQEVEALQGIQVPKQEKQVNPKGKLDVRKLMQELDDMCRVMDKKEPWMPDIHSLRCDEPWKKQLIPVGQQMPLQSWQGLLNYLSSRENKNVENLYIESQNDEVGKTQKKLNRKLRGTNAVKAQQRMTEKKVGRSERYLLKEFSKGDKKHYIIVKKKTPLEPPVEEIFTEWKKNLDFSNSEPKRIPRVRKLSHRAERKAKLREPSPIKPAMLYSDVLKKHLKLLADPMEDIYESWRDYLQELDDCLTSPPQSPTPEDVVNNNHLSRNEETIFAGWRHQLEGHQRLLNNSLTSGKGPQSEDLFASWRHVFDGDLTKPKGARQPEDCFAAWRQIFDQKCFESIPVPGSIEQPEDYLNDWLKLSNPEILDQVYHEEKESLKNKKRSQRKSTNKKKQKF